MRIHEYRPETRPDPSGNGYLWRVLHRFGKLSYGTIDWSDWEVADHGWNAFLNSAEDVAIRGAAYRDDLTQHRDNPWTEARP